MDLAIAEGVGNTIRKARQGLEFVLPQMESVPLRRGMKSGNIDSS